MSTKNFEWISREEYDKYSQRGYNEVRKSRDYWDAFYARLAEVEASAFEPAGLIVKNIAYLRIGWAPIGKECAERKRDHKLDSWDRSWFSEPRFVKVSRGRIGKWIRWNPDPAKMVEEAVAALPETEYGRFAGKFRRLIKAKGLEKCWAVYPTEYGIGLWIYYNWNAERDAALVRQVMDESKVSYTNEYSDKLWVYRFRLSKEQGNLERIDEVLKAIA